MRSGRDDARLVRDRQRDAGRRMIPVALIEDNRLVREGITSLLERTPDLRVIAAGAGSDLVMLHHAKPAVILLDVRLSNTTSLGVAESVRRDHPRARVIVMDLLPLHEDVVDFVNAGVSGFVLKDASVDDLIGTIRLVAEGAHVLPPAMTSTLFSQIAREAVLRSRRAAAGARRITAREREVIDLIGAGLSNGEIATRLHIATHTAKSHVRNVMEKLTLRSRLQIAAFAHRTADTVAPGPVRASPETAVNGGRS